MTTALLLIDIQNDYFPGGAMVLSGPEKAAEQASALLAAFRQKALPIFHVQHVSTRPGATSNTWLCPVLDFVAYC